MKHLIKMSGYSGTRIQVRTKLLPVIDGERLLWMEPDGQLSEHIVFG